MGVDGIVAARRHLDLGLPGKAGIGINPLSHAPRFSLLSTMPNCIAGLALQKCGAQPLRPLAPPPVGPNSVPCPFFLPWPLQVHESTAGLVAPVLAACRWATTSRAAVPCRLYARTTLGLQLAAACACKKKKTLSLLRRGRWDRMARLIAVHALSPCRPIVLRGRR